ncbi:hypothetical protein BDW69DRAFT_189012 [Aspergillus filifer]
MAESTVSKISSNQRRTSWRVQCRNRLSVHIRLQVDPDEVRLQPDDGTLYAWEVDDPQLESLFKKPLSKHSVGAYVELCSEVGKSFRAVSRDKAVRSSGEQLQALEEEKTRLESAVRAATMQNQVLNDEKRALETQLQDMVKQIAEKEQEIAALENRACAYQKQANEWMSVAECYERTYTQCSAGLSQAILFLQSVSADNPLPDLGPKLAV